VFCFLREKKKTAGKRRRKRRERRRKGKKEKWEKFVNMEISRKIR
jgi:hypothetical protein